MDQSLRPPDLQLPAAMLPRLQSCGVPEGSSGYVDGDLQTEMYVAYYSRCIPSMRSANCTCIGMLQSLTSVRQRWQSGDSSPGNRSKLHKHLAVLLGETEVLKRDSGKSPSVQHCIDAGSSANARRKCYSQQLRHRLTRRYPDNIFQAGHRIFLLLLLHAQVILSNFVLARTNFASAGRILQF